MLAGAQSHSPRGRPGPPCCGPRPPCRPATGRCPPSPRRGTPGRPAERAPATACPRHVLFTRGHSHGSHKQAQSVTVTEVTCSHKATVFTATIVTAGTCSQNHGIRKVWQSQSPVNHNHSCSGSRAPCNSPGFWCLRQLSNCIKLTCFLVLICI